MKRKLLALLLILTLTFTCVLSASACKKTAGIDNIKVWNAKNVYLEAQKLGYEGSLEEFMETIKGKDAAAITSATVNDDGYLVLDFSDGKELIVGKVKGDKGEDGLSAYEIYKKYHPDYTGSEEDWINDLVNGRLATEEQNSNTPSEIEKTTYDITLWVSESMEALTKKQIADFNETDYAKENGVVINATVKLRSVADAATDFIAAGAQNAPDIYCFTQDQISRLIRAGGLSKIGTETAQTVIEANNEGVVAAATVDNELYAYPMTSDNGYFMYYDKSVIPEEHIGSLEDIIADCEKAGKFISYELETSAWYTASFFFGTGCVSEWTTDENGKFVSVNDTFYSEKGLIAAKGMYKLLKSRSHVNSSDITDFDAGSAVVISGMWYYDMATAILGDNLGCAKLPCYTVDGKQYQIGSFSGCKLMGVKPQTDAKKSAVCHALAQFLTDYDRQVERFEKLEWAPANLEAQMCEAVQFNPALVALFAQNAYSVPQGLIHGSWWEIGKIIATDIKDSDGTDEGLMAALKKYNDNINMLFQ